MTQPFEAVTRQGLTGASLAPMTPGFEPSDLLRVAGLPDRNPAELRAQDAGAHRHGVVRL